MVAHAEFAEGVRRIRRCAEHPIGAGTVILQAFLIFRMHGIDLLVDQLGIEGRRYKKMGESVQRPLQRIVLHREEVGGTLAFRVRVGEWDFLRWKRHRQSKEKWRE